MSDDLISRKFLLECAEYDNNGRLIVPYRYVKNAPTAFDKERVIDELESWKKASYNAGIQSNYAGLDNKASTYYQESRAYHRALEIVEKGGLN